LAGAIDFINGQGIRINHAGASFTLNPPTAGTVTPTGTPGGTAYAYTIASLNATGGVGQSITNITTATGNASLSATNFNHIAWTASSGGATAYAVYGRTAGSLTLLGITTGVVFDDIGQTGPTPPDWIPTAPQTGASLPSWLITTISSGASTTTLTLAANASNTATTQVVIHDDTIVVQTALTTAQTLHQALYLSCGSSYQITTALSITSNVEITGCGYQGDSGQTNIGGAGSYNTAANITTGSGWKGSTLICAALNNCINIATNDSVLLHQFQITYPVRAAAGIIGIKANPAAGGTSNNTASTFRDLFISGPDIGITLTDFINFSIDRLTIAAWTNNVVLSSVNYPSFGDSHIQNSWFYGRNLTSNILVNASAGIAITNNKIVSGTVGINVNTTLIGNQIEPLIIANNSLEGQTTAIQFAEAAGSTTGASQFFINNNQIFVGNTGAIGISFIYTGTVWISGYSISNNIIVLNNAGSTCISIDGAQAGNIENNTLNASAGTSTGIVLGSHTNTNLVQGNTYNATFATQFTDAGTTNAIAENLGTAWTTYVPALSCGTATFVVNSARFKKIGKTVLISIDFNISAIGTCTIVTSFTLPATPQSGSAMAGRESALNGTAVEATISAGSATASMTKNANAVWLVNERAQASGVYESQ